MSQKYHRPFFIETSRTKIAGHRLASSLGCFSSENLEYEDYERGSAEEYLLDKKNNQQLMMPKYENPHFGHV